MIEAIRRHAWPSVAMLLAVLGVVVLLMGCSTILQSSAQTIPVQSSPAGATVTLDGVVVGVTPMEVTLNPKRSYALVLTKDGYAPVRRELVPSFAWENFGPLAYNANNHKPVDVTLRRL